MSSPAVRAVTTFMVAAAPAALVLWDVIVAGCGGTTRAEADAAAIDAALGTRTSTIDAPQENTPNDCTQDAAACVCELDAASYDRSCSTASDCVSVALGAFFCQPTCSCANSAISLNALAQYQRDYARTPLGSGAFDTTSCGCPLESAPCCNAGQCDTCAPTPIEAGADANYYATPGSTWCSPDAGLIDAGAPDSGLQFCVPPEKCLPFNGGYACCTSAGPGNTLCRTGF